MATTPRAARRTAACGLISLCVLFSLLLLSALENAANAWSTDRSKYTATVSLTPLISIGDCQVTLSLGASVGPPYRVDPLSPLAARFLRLYQPPNTFQPISQVAFIGQSLIGGSLSGLNTTAEQIQEDCTNNNSPAPADLSVVYNRIDGSTWRDAVSAEFQLRGTEGDDVHLYTFSFIAVKEPRVAAKDNVPEPFQSKIFAPPTLETLTETDDEITLAGFNFIDDDATLINWGNVSITGDALTIDAAVDAIGFECRWDRVAGMDHGDVLSGAPAHAIGQGIARCTRAAPDRQS